jgi:ABC-type tungstate transport system substrate-binding protein
MISTWSFRTFITIMLLITLYLAPTPKAEAFEPISMSIVAAILLPYAIKFVKFATPYVIKGAVNGGKAMLDVFIEMSGFLLFPFGMMEASVGAPFGLFPFGLRHMGDGCLAPFKSMWAMMRVPVRVFTG